MPEAKPIWLTNVGLVETCPFWATHSRLREMIFICWVLQFWVWVWKTDALVLELWSYCRWRCPSSFISPRRLKFPVHTNVILIHISHPFIISRLIMFGPRSSKSTPNATTPALAIPLRIVFYWGGGRFLLSKHIPTESHPSKSEIKIKKPPNEPSSIWKPNLNPIPWSKIYYYLSNHIPILCCIIPSPPNPALTKSISILLINPQFQFSYRNSVGEIKTFGP